jgi:hypothetical protein
MADIDEDSKDPLTFTPGTQDQSKKDEKAVREEEKQAFQNALGDTGAKPPLPDSIKLAHPKPPFVEAIESMFQAVAQFLKQLNPQNKDVNKDKNKPL